MPSRFESVAMMSSITIVTCDCGCDTKYEPDTLEWLTLENYGQSKRDSVHLLRVLHFSSLKCLAEWAARAADVAPSLRDAADNIPKHGTLVSDTVKEIAAW